MNRYYRYKSVATQIRHDGKVIKLLHNLMDNNLFQSESIYIYTR
jgi:hypothetical protein